MRCAPLALLVLCLGAGSPGHVPAPAPVAARSSPRDFDFEFGSWTTRLRVLRHPLTGSKEWVEYRGTTVVRKVWDGKANLVELEADGPAGHLEALSLRLFDPASGTWSLNFANSRSGSMSPPSVGGFRDGRGEFMSHETLDGRPILVRFVIEPVTRDSIRFEQAFSADSGRTWEVNWIANDTR